jgi:hypothetical protein
MHGRKIIKLGATVFEHITNAHSSCSAGMMLCNVVWVDTTVSEEPSVSFLRVGHVALTIPEIEPRFPRRRSRSSHHIDLAALHTASSEDEY